MVTPFEIYLIGNMDSLKNLFIIAVIFLVIALVALACMMGYESDIYQSIGAKTKRYFIYVLLATVFSSLVAALIPSSETLAAMYVLPSITKQAANLPKKAVKLASVWLDEETKKIGTEQGE